MTHMGARFFSLESGSFEGEADLKGFFFSKEKKRFQASVLSVES